MFADRGERAGRTRDGGLAKAVADGAVDVDAHQANTLHAVIMDEDGAVTAH